MLLRASPWLFALLLSACAVRPPSSRLRLLPCRRPRQNPLPAPAPPALIPTPVVPYPTLKPVDWAAVAFWQDDKLSETWTAFLRSCSTLVKRTAWQAVCADAATMATPDDTTVRTFFEQRFQPYQATQDDGSAEGMITGLLRAPAQGRRVRTARARFPLYAVPDDLITVDLASVYPELKNLRLRGRLVGNKIVPYPTRKEIEVAANGNGFKGKPIAWQRIRSICSSCRSRVRAASNCPTARICG